MIPFDLAVGLGMIRRGEYMTQSFGFEILARVPTYQCLAVIWRLARPVQETSAVEQVIRKR